MLTRRCYRPLPEQSVFVALGGRFLFGERFAYTFLVGMSVALAGAVLLMGGDLGLGLRQLIWDALAVLAAVFYAGYILSVRRLRSSLSTAAVITYGGVVTCVALLLIALLSGEHLLATSAYGWLMLLGIAIVSQVGGQNLTPTPSPTCRPPSPRSACSCSPSPPGCSPGPFWAKRSDGGRHWAAPSC